MNDPISILQKELTALQAQINPLMSRRDEIERQLRFERSREFIRVNDIKKADVELSGGDGKPWFGNVIDFIEWLKANSSKNWVEWNTVIYRRSDLIERRMPSMPSTIHELE